MYDLLFAVRTLDQMPIKPQTKKIAFRHDVFRGNEQLE